MPVKLHKFAHAIPVTLHRKGSPIGGTSAVEIDLGGYHRTLSRDAAFKLRDALDRILGRVDLSTVKRYERGYAGHFISSQRCSFRRNTLVQADDGRGIVVSTVGNMRVDDPEGVREIGLERHYETMMFRAVEEDGYLEADVHRELLSTEQWKILGVTHTTDLDADAMHEANVLAVMRDFDRTYGNDSWFMPTELPAPK